MGILGRINKVIQSNVNAALDKMTDPAKEIDLLVTDMESSLAQARQEVVSCTAQAKLAAQRTRELEGEAAQWEKRAMQAVRADDEGLAREALTRKANVEQSLMEARRTQQEQEGYQAELTAALKKLEARIQDVKARKETLKAQAKAAKQGRSGLAGGKAFEDFERMESRIEAIEAEGELTAGTDARDAATEARFARLESQSSDPKVEDELAELKRRMRGE